MGQSDYLMKEKTNIRNTDRRIDEQTDRRTYVQANGQTDTHK